MACERTSLWGHHLVLRELWSFCTSPATTSSLSLRYVYVPLRAPFSPLWLGGVEREMKGGKRRRRRETKGEERRRRGEEEGR